MVAKKEENFSFVQISAHVRFIHHRKAERKKKFFPLSRSAPTDEFLVL